MINTSMQGRVALITGAGSGLGAATARVFARAGAAVACIDITQPALEQLCAELTSADLQAIPIVCDVSNEVAVAQAMQTVIDQFGRLDVLVNNAAIDHTVSVDEMTIAQWDQVIGVNLRGPFLFAKAALPIMRRQHSGHIVNVASTAATRAWANAAAYHASKWGLIGLSRGLGVEGRPDHIRVTAVLPGGMRTGFFDRFIDQGIPMPQEQNLQDPMNVAEAILFAVSMPEECVLQELIVTPMTETSWP